MNPVYLGMFISVAIFLISHLGLAIWFASKINAKVTDLTETMKVMAVEIKALSAFSTRLAVLEERMSRSEQDSREALKAAALLANQR